MKSRRIIIPALVLGIFMLVGVFWAGKTTTQAATPSQSVVDKLVERFNLNRDEVAGVFDEVYKERQQQRQEQRRAYMEARLDEAVGDGAITAEQKQTLLDKDTGMQEKYRQLREEMRQWKEESGIDFEKLAPYRVGFGHRGFARPPVSSLAGEVGRGRGHGFGGW